MPPKVVNPQHPLLTECAKSNPRLKKVKELIASIKKNAEDEECISVALAILCNNHPAIDDNLIALTKLLLEAGALLDKHKELLYTASKYGYLPIIEHFFEQIDKKDKDQSAALLLNLIRNGKPTREKNRLVERLFIEKELGPNIVSVGTHNSILHSACFLGDVGLVQIILARRAVQLNMLNNRMQTPLISAFIGTHANYARIVELLTNAGCSVNHQDENGRTALHYAVEKGYFEACELLLLHGADVTLIDGDNHSPLSLPNKTAKITTLLLSHLEKLNDPMHKIKSRCVIFSLEKPENNCLELFVSAEKSGFASIAEMSPKQRIELFHYAVALNNGLLIHKLVEAGFSLTYEDEEARLPVYTALRCFAEKSLAALLLLGQDHSIRDAEGNTLLHNAAILGDHEGIAILLAHGMNANALNNDKKTPLQLAINLGSISMLIDASTKETLELLISDLEPSRLDFYLHPEPSRKKLAQVILDYYKTCPPSERRTAFIRIAMSKGAVLVSKPKDLEAVATSKGPAAAKATSEPKNPPNAAQSSTAKTLEALKSSKPLVPEVPPSKEARQTKKTKKIGFVFMNEEELAEINRQCAAYQEGQQAGQPKP